MYQDNDRATSRNSSGLSLRPPIASDYGAIASWIADAHACARWAGPQLPFPFAATELPALLAGGDAATNYSLVDAGAAFIGFGQLVNKAPDLVRLARIIVAPDRRGQGVGRILCQQLIAEAKRRPSVTALSLGVYRDNTAAITLYMSLGFVEAPPHSRPEIVSMQKRLVD
jgi:ribosomal protein S18 acetylase RimI-like enzyme